MVSFLQGPFEWGKVGINWPETDRQSHMLPFMKPHRLDTVIMASHKPEGGVKDEGIEGEPNHALMAAAEDLIRAVHSKDVKAVAEALECAAGACEEYEDESHEMSGDE